MYKFVIISWPNVFLASTEDLHAVTLLLVYRRVHYIIRVCGCTGVRGQARRPRGAAGEHEQQVLLLHQDQGVVPQLLPQGAPGNK